jgi:hypothetical protein
METVKVISGNTEQELWPEIEADLAPEEVYDYNVLLKQGGHETELIIDIDLGGGFEGGWEYTILKAPIATTNNFRFAIHDETFIDKVGKFFGMQDVVIGFEGLDRHLIVKSNDEGKVRSLFADADVRKVFASLDSFHCGIHTHHESGSDKDQPFLELNIDEGINESAPLRRVYHAFYQLLTEIEA